MEEIKNIEDETFTLNETLCGIFHKDDYELELDNKISKKYDLEKQRILLKVFGNLIDGTNSYINLKRKVISKLENDLQVVELLSSGSSLSQEKLDLINQRYNEGANAEIEPYRNGTKIAGYFLSKLNGTVCIENCNQGGYTVKNIIRLPA